MYWDIDDNGLVVLGVMTCLIPVSGISWVGVLSWILEAGVWRFLVWSCCGRSGILNYRRADECVDSWVAGLSADKDGGRPPAGAATDLGVRPCRQAVFLWFGRAAPQKH